MRSKERSKNGWVDVHGYVLGTRGASLSRYQQEVIGGSASVYLTCEANTSAQRWVRVGATAGRKCVHTCAPTEVDHGSLTCSPTQLQACKGVQSCEHADSHINCQFTRQPTDLGSKCDGRLSISLRWSAVTRVFARCLFRISLRSSDGIRVSNTDVTSLPFM